MFIAIRAQSKQAAGCFPSGTLLKALVSGTLRGKQSLNYPSLKLLCKAAALWNRGFPRASTKRKTERLLCESFSYVLCLSLRVSNEAIKFISAAPHLIWNSSLPVSMCSLIPDQGFDCPALPPPQQAQKQSQGKSSPVGVNHHPLP